MRLYDFPDSGNGHEVRLLLAHLGRSYPYVTVDLLAGESRTPAFLAMNPNGRIPVLELDDGTHLAPEGGFDLGPFHALRAWLDRVAGLPGHVPITAPPAR